MNSTSAVRPATSNYRWMIVLMLSSVSFVLYIDRVNIMVVAPYLATEFGLSAQQLGHVLSAFLFGYALGLVPGGWLADRFGARRVLTLAGLSWAVLTLSMGLIPKVHVGQPRDPELALVSLRFLLGLCEACAFPTFARTLANWMKPGERAMASGLIHAGANLGGIVAPVFVYFFINYFGWRQSFFSSGVITLPAVIWWWLKARNSPAEHPSVSETEFQLIAADREKAHPAKPDSEWYKCLLRSRNAYMLCVSEVFYGLCSFVFLTWLYFYFVKVRGAGDLYSAVVSSLIYIAGAIGALLGGLLCDRSFRRWGRRWGRRIVPLLSILSSGTCSIVAPVIHNNAVSAAVFSLAAGALFFAAPAFWATVIDITRRGPGILGGLMNSSGNLGAATGTVIFPWLVARASWETAFQLTGVAGLLSGLTWLFIDSSHQIDR